MELIQTKDYLLWIDKKAEIKYNTIIFESDTCLINIVGKDYIHNKTDFKIIAYYPLTKEAEELDLPLLPPFEEVNIEKAAQPKQYSEEDMRDIMEEALNWWGGGRDKDISDSEDFFERYIKSLSTQQLPIVFIPEFETKVIKYIPYPKEMEIKGQGWEIGYPVTEKVLKTITNSQGQKVVQGEYIFK